MDDGERSCSSSSYFRVPDRFEGGNNVSPNAKRRLVESLSTYSTLNGARGKTFGEEYG